MSSTKAINLNIHIKFYSALAALFVACTVGTADVPAQAQINTTVIDSTPKSLSLCKITPNTRGLAWSKAMEVLNTNGEAEMMVLDKNYTNPSSNLLSQLFDKTPQVQKLYLSVWTADGVVLSPWLKSRGEDEWRIDSISLNGVSLEQVAIKIGNDAYPVK